MMVDVVAMRPVRVVPLVAMITTGAMVMAMGRVAVADTG